MTARPWWSRWPAAALITGAALAGGAVAGIAATRPPGHDYGTVPAAAAAPAAPAGQLPTAAGASGARPPGHAPRGAPAAVTVTHTPARLRIPAIGVNAPVIPVGVEPGGWLAIPADPAVIGWWAGGGWPGQRAGAVIVTGHIDSASRGPGALLRLQDARPGESVTVTAGGHAYRYRIVALRAYAKTDLPVATVFGQHVTARLVIISCGGQFDPATGHYQDNIVAYAVPDDGS